MLPKVYMRVRADLVCLAIIAASWSRPSVSTASPIADLEWSEDGDFFAFKTSYQLTDSDLSVLAAREDKGWHLGWFLQDRVWVAGDHNVLGLPDISDALIAATMPRRRVGSRRIIVGGPDQSHPRHCECSRGRAGASDPSADRNGRLRISGPPATPLVKLPQTDDRPKVPVVPRTCRHRRARRGTGESPCTAPGAGTVGRRAMRRHGS